MTHTAYQAEEHLLQRTEEEEQSNSIDKSSRVLSGGTGEASQETLRLHFQRAGGLSPIRKLESEGFSLASIGFTQQQTSISNSNLNQFTTLQQPGSTHKKLSSRLSDRRARHNQQESFHSAASHSKQHHHSDQDGSPTAANFQSKYLAQDSIAEEDEHHELSGPASGMLPSEPLQVNSWESRESQEAEAGHPPNPEVFESTGSLETSELRTKEGFYKAQTHERTSDLSLMDKIVYEKRNVNQLVESELAEFRKEIEAKFSKALTKHFAMSRQENGLDFYPQPRGQSLASKQKLSGDKLNSVRSRVTVSQEQAEHSSLVHDSLNNCQFEEIEGLNDSGGQRVNFDGVQDELFGFASQSPQSFQDPKLAASQIYGQGVQSMGTRSPISVDLKNTEQEIRKDSARKKAPQTETRTSKQGQNHPPAQDPKSDATSKKEEKLRKFAKQLYKRHVKQVTRQTEADQSMVSGTTQPHQSKEGPAPDDKVLSKLLIDLVSQQKWQFQPDAIPVKQAKSVICTRKEKPTQQQGDNGAQRQFTLQSRQAKGAKTSFEHKKRSNSNQRHLVGHDGTSQLSCDGTKKQGFQTIQDGKNNNLISIAQKRRRAGISTRQERGSKSITRKSESQERNCSQRPSQKGVIHIQKSMILKSSQHGAQGNQSSHSKGKRTSARQNQEPISFRGSFTMGNALAKSQGAPSSTNLAKSIKLRTSGAKNAPEQNLYKLFKDFEERIEGEGAQDKQPMQASKRDRSSGNRPKQSTLLSMVTQYQSSNGSISRAQSVPRASIQNIPSLVQNLMGSKLVMAKASNELSAEDQNQLFVQPRKQRQNLGNQNYLLVPQPAKQGKTKEIKQLSTVQESLLISDLAKQTQPYKQPQTAKNSGIQNAAKAVPHSNFNLRVKTPNGGNQLAGKIVANQHSGSGNRANLFNKYLRASDISTQKRSSTHKQGSSRIKKKDCSLGQEQQLKISWKQAVRSGDSVGSVRNSSIASQGRQHAGLTQNICATEHKTQLRSKSGKGMRATDPVKVYQTYFGQTTARLSGFNRRSQLSRQAGASIDTTQQLLEGSHKTNSSLAQPKTFLLHGAKEGIEMQLANATSAQTPGTQLAQPAMVQLDAAHSTGIRAPTYGGGQSSMAQCKKQLELSAGYPQGAGFVQGEASATQTLLGGKDALAAQLGGKINIKSKIKVHKQSNSSLGYGSATTGLVLGHNTVQILKPTQSQQKLSNSLQKASSFENQFGSKPQAVVNFVTNAKAITLKSSDIVRASSSGQGKKGPSVPAQFKLNIFSQRLGSEQSLKQSQKKVFMQIAANLGSAKGGKVTLQATRKHSTSSTSKAKLFTNQHASTASRKSWKHSQSVNQSLHAGSQARPSDCLNPQSQQICLASGTNLVATSKQLKQQTQWQLNDNKQAQTTKHSSSIAAQHSVLGQSLLSLSKAAKGSHTFQLLNQNSAHSAKKQKRSNSGNATSQQKMIQALKAQQQQLAKGQQQLLSSRSVRRSQGDKTHSQSRQNNGSQSSQHTHRRKPSKELMTHKSVHAQGSNSSAAVLLDIDTLVRNSAAAAIYQSQAKKAPDAGRDPQLRAMVPLNSTRNASNMSGVMANKSGAALHPLSSDDLTQVGMHQHSLGAPPLIGHKKHVSTQNTTTVATACPSSSLDAQVTLQLQKMLSGVKQQTSAHGTGSLSTAVPPPGLSSQRYPHTHVYI